MGAGAAMPSEAGVASRSIVSTSVLDMLEGVLRWVEHMPLLLNLSDVTDVLRERDCLGEILGVIVGVRTCGVCL
jgi:hypothetical protein